MDNLAIQLQAIDKIYHASSGEVSALKQVNLSISLGQHIAIVGKSGSGKSTLLNIISGIDKPSSGQAKVLGYRLNELDEKSLATWRGKHVGDCFPILSSFFDPISD